MKTSIVFLDIDGTCYEANEHFVADSLVRAVHELKERDIKVVICTGRSKDQLAGIENELISLPFDAYVTSAGAEAYLHDGTTIHQEYIDEEIVKRILAYVESVSYDVDVIYRDGKGSGILKEMGSSGMFNFAWFGIDPYPIRKMDTASLIHILIAEKGHHDEVMTHMGGTNVYVTSPESIEAFKEHVNKLHGVKALCNYYNIPLQEAMAFGDGEVDVEMLEGVGYGVAMGNACVEAKKCADEVCDDMHTDTIYTTLKKHGVI